MRYLVFFVLFAIVVSMASALFFLYRDAGEGKSRMVKALATRVGLSIGLFIFLMVSYKLGVIPSTGLR